MEQPVFNKINDEINQGPRTRHKLYEEIEKILERPVIAYFTSFLHPVAISDEDVDMLLELLRGTDLSSGLAVIISSPGGDGLASERIINLLREYSGTKEFKAIVPSRAKSAGTMICLGASAILMSPSSELGPVDPQVIRVEDGQQKAFSVHNYIKSYETLFKRAVSAKGNLEPFLQQLRFYDEREIQEMRSAVELSEDITIRALQTGMMKGKTAKAIREQMRVFLNPSAGTKSHGRPILCQESKGCGLNIETMGIDTSLWQNIYELYMRLDRLVSTAAAKCIESRSKSFVAKPSR